jgi:hypothetical protein
MKATDIELGAEVLWVRRHKTHYGRGRGTLKANRVKVLKRCSSGKFFCSVLDEPALPEWDVVVGPRNLKILRGGNGDET